MMIPENDKNWRVQGVWGQGIITYEENLSKPEEKRSMAGKGNGWG
jgi:hypothetical protein